MAFQKLISGIKLIALTGCVLISTTAYSQGDGNKNQPDNSRAKVMYKQTHGLNEFQDNKLLADGFKLKMDISVLDEAINEREAIDMDAIPSEELYGGIWTNIHVDAYGSKTNEPTEFEVDLSNFTMPVVGHVTSNFGRRGSRRYHYGVDVKAQTGDTIYAAFDGKVRVKQYDRRGYGYYIVIRHLNGLETVYGHLSKFLIAENDFVMSGDPIGLAGNTGRSFGSHLHLETRFLGKPIDPNFIIDFDNHVCHRDSYIVSTESFKKTTLSSRVIKRTTADNYVKSSSTESTNKYVSGEVKHYRIKKGDTLIVIAKRNGVTVKQLCELNNITARTTLRIGRSLRIS
ncbi:MAG: M23 family metallopeptidase [Dysgonamonadaceae bacterium]|nr:M23 family metallopeptidase [Dysgonamonadaceae bacterium]MDD4729981.1 M23 family metallopeptidase [Dysgonamonadaceae bacterium]